MHLHRIVLAAALRVRVGCSGDDICRVGYFFSGVRSCMLISAIIWCAQSFLLIWICHARHKWCHVLNWFNAMVGIHYKYNVFQNMLFWPRFISSVNMHTVIYEWHDGNGANGAYFHFGFDSAHKYKEYIYFRYPKLGFVSNQDMLFYWYPICWLKRLNQQKCLGAFDLGRGYFGEGGTTWLWYYNQLDTTHWFSMGSKTCAIYNKGWTTLSHPAVNSKVQTGMGSNYWDYNLGVRAGTNE